MSKSLLATSTTLLILFISIFGTASCQTSSKNTAIDSLEKQLDRLVPTLLSSTKVPGVSIAVLRNGKMILAKAYGFADKSSGDLVTPLTRFQIGSVSKTLTAAAVLKMAKEGKIKLDDPLEQYLKSWHLPPGEFDNNKVTIRMVLSHTAGFTVKGYHGVFKPVDKLPTLAESLNGYSGSDGALKVISEPGTVFQYSSGGYTLLQLMIEDITCISFAEYMDQKLFAPLKMENTSYALTKEGKNTAATPYDENGNPWPHYQFIEKGSGGIYTTASDLAKFLSVLCRQNQDQLLDTAFVLQMTKASPGTKGNYGLGVKIFPVNESQTLITHDGANEGWRAAYYLHPLSGDAVVILTNSDQGGKTGAPIICTAFNGTAVNLSKLCSDILK